MDGAVFGFLTSPSAAMRVIEFDSNLKLLFADSNNTIFYFDRSTGKENDSFSTQTIIGADVGTPFYNGA